MRFPKCVTSAKFYFCFSFPQASLFIKWSIFQFLMRTFNMERKKYLWESAFLPTKWLFFFFFLIPNSKRVGRPVFNLLQPEGPEAVLEIVSCLLSLCLICPCSLLVLCTAAGARTTWWRGVILTWQASTTAGFPGCVQNSSKSTLLRRKSHNNL